MGNRLPQPVQNEESDEDLNDSSVSYAMIPSEIPFLIENDKEVRAGNPNELKTEERWKDSND